MSSPKIHPNTSAWLDVFRALASQAVVLGHAHALFFAAAGTGLMAKLVTGASAFSHQAVIVFFVVSGYLVGGKMLQDARAGTFQPRVYAINRLSRLLVVVIPALLLTCVVDVAAFRLGDGAHFVTSRAPFYPEGWEQGGAWTASTFLSNAVFLQMIASVQFGTNLSLWSLSNEFWYYVLFPCLACAVVCRSTGDRLAAAAAATAVLVLFLNSGIDDPDRPAMYLIYFGIWMAGAFARIVPSSWRRAAGATALVVGVAATVLVMGAPRIDRSLRGDVLAAVAFIGMLLLSQDVPGKRMGRLFRFAAGYSFSLYAVHLPLLVLLMCFGSPAKAGFSAVSVTAFCGYVVAVNLLAVLFWYLTERNTDGVRRGALAVAPTVQFR